MPHNDQAGGYRLERLRDHYAAISIPSADGTAADYTSTVLVMRESSPIARMLIPALCPLALSVIASRTAASTKNDPCQFDQTWSGGDQHYYELLELRADKTGRWSEGGMAGDAPHGQVDFRWQRTDDTFTAVFDAAEHTVHYKVELRGENYCRLTLATHPFADRAGALLLSNGPPW